MDASLTGCSTPPLWHTKAVGGRPPHQALFPCPVTTQTTRLAIRPRHTPSCTQIGPIGLAPVAGSARLPNSAPHGSTSGFWHDRVTGSQNPMAGLRADDVSQEYTPARQRRETLSASHKG